MKVNEELNALQTMGLSPVQFLVVQRVVAGILLAPVLTIFAMYAGLLGGIPVLLGLGFPLRMVLHQIQSGVHFGGSGRRHSPRASSSARLSLR